MNFEFSRQKYVNKLFSFLFHKKIWIFNLQFSNYLSNKIRTLRFHEKFFRENKIKLSVFPLKIKYYTLFLPRRRISRQSVNCSSVSSCFDNKSLNSSIGKLMISWTDMGKLRPNARRSSRVNCDTLTPGGNPAILAAASAAKDFRFLSRFVDPDPEGPGMPADEDAVDIEDPICAIWLPVNKWKVEFSR